MFCCPSRRSRPQSESRDSRPHGLPVLAFGDKNNSNLYFMSASDHNSILETEELSNRPFKLCFYSACATPQGFIISGGSLNSAQHHERECYSFTAHLRKWETLPSMSVPRYLHASIYHDGKVYVVGGKFKQEAYHNSVEYLDLRTQKWSSLPSLQYPISGCYVVFVSNVLFVLSGWNGLFQYSHDVNQFDSATEEWVSRSPMPEECEDGAAVSFDGKIYVVGGFGRTCMHYNSREDHWVNLKRPLSMHNYGAVLIWNKKIVVFGGSCTTEIEAYDLETGHWSTWDLQMPQAMEMAFAVTVNLNEACNLEKIEILEKETDSAKEEYIELREQMRQQSEVIRQQQMLIERLDQKERARNLVIIGVPENRDPDKVTQILEKLKDEADQ